ncbi:hypothetical protein MHYP_G00027080 [Metynnis hypsauchen]
MSGNDRLLSHTTIAACVLLCPGLQDAPCTLIIQTVRGPGALIQPSLWLIWLIKFSQQRPAPHTHTYLHGLLICKLNGQLRTCSTLS